MVIKSTRYTMDVRMLILLLFYIIISSTSAANTRQNSQLSKSDQQVGSPPKSLTGAPTINSVMEKLEIIVDKYMKNFERKFNEVTIKLTKTDNTINKINENIGYILESIYPQSCNSVDLNLSQKTNKITTIKPPGIPPTKVLCEMDCSGNVWTIIHRRQNGKEKFNRTFEEYKKGFGNPSEEYWIGNEVLHSLTSWQPHSLKIELEAFDGKKASAFYDSFKVGPENDYYRLTVKDFDISSSAGDGLKAHDQMPFTTIDSDNDQTKDGNCALLMGGGGGWWYNACYHVLGTGTYSKTKGNERGHIHWYPWKDVKHSLKSFVMYIHQKELHGKASLKNAWNCP